MLSVASDSVPIFGVLNSDRQMTTTDIMLKYLKLTGHTRIQTNVAYGDVTYGLTADKYSTADTITRYGIKSDTNHYSSDYFCQEEEPFPESDLDEKTMIRINEKINALLDNDINQDFQKGRMQMCHTVLLALPTGIEPITNP